MLSVFDEILAFCGAQLVDQFPDFRQTALPLHVKLRVIALLVLKAGAQFPDHFSAKPSAHALPRPPIASFVFLSLSLPLALAAQLKSPAQYFPHPPGEQFTRHDQLTAYFEYLSANSPQTMRLERYGFTNEERPLSRWPIFSSPENMARLEQIRSTTCAWPAPSTASPT